MGWATRRMSGMIPSLTIALAIVGTIGDALPIPILEAAGLCHPGSDGPFTPSREDERDETPDDASDLAWPEVGMLAGGRGHSRDSRSARAPGAPGTLTAQSVGLLRGQARRPSNSRAATVPLSIRLCRLTC